MFPSLSQFAGFLSLLLGLVSGCGSGTAEVKAEVEVLKERNRKAEDQIAELKLQLQLQAGHLDNVEREWWSDKFCNSGKNARYASKIAEFIGQVQARVPGTCTAENLESALIFMNNQPYALARYRPNGLAQDLHLSRRGHLKNVLDARYIHPSTRLLVLVQPEAETEAAQKRALELGNEFIELIRKEINTDPKLRVLGPHLLPCRLKTEISRLYNTLLDKSLPFEPREEAPQIRVWTFRTDC